MITPLLALILVTPSAFGAKNLSPCGQVLTELHNQQFSSSEVATYVEQKEKELALRGQGSDLDFSLKEYNRRMTELRQVFAKNPDLQAIIVAGTEEISYFTGYETTGTTAFEALVVPRQGRPFAINRLLEANNITARTWIAEQDALFYEDGYYDVFDPVAANPYFRLYSAFRERGIPRGAIAIDRGNLSTTAFDNLTHWFSKDYNWIDETKHISSIHVIKSEEEISLLRRLSILTQEVLAVGIRATYEGASHKDILAKMSAALVQTWGDAPAVRPYVSVAEQSLIGHHTASGEPRWIKKGDVVFLEVAAASKGYHVAMMRPVLIGPPRPEVLEASATTEKLLQQQLKLMRAEARSGDIYTEINSGFEPLLNKYKGTQKTRIAYTLGLARPPEWGPVNGPSIQKNDPTKLKPGMVFHVIPWTQFPLYNFAMTISETAIVNSEGGAERLSTMPMRIVVKSDGYSIDTKDTEWRDQVYRQ